MHNDENPTLGGDLGEGWGSILINLDYLTLICVYCLFGMGRGGIGLAVSRTWQRFRFKNIGFLRLEKAVLNISALEYNRCCKTYT